MPCNLVHGSAEVDFLLTGLAEADGWLIGLPEVLPELRAFETKLNRAVGDGGHGDWKRGEFKL